MNKNEFITSLKNLNLPITTEKLQLLALYFQELITYNEHTNLTAITTEEDVYLKHFYDSLTIAKVLDLNTINNLLDIGSGAGFPGIVLKIFYPHLQVTLIDANNKKTTFLKYLVTKLGLKDVSVIHDRVENYSLEHLNSFDLVTARAVTRLNVLSELALPLVKKHGYFVAMKGNVSSEIEDGEYAILKMKGEIKAKTAFYLNNQENLRTLIKVEKVEETLAQELRPYEKIVKKPLQKRK